jgi:hypothetical protein
MFMDWTPFAAHDLAHAIMGSLSRLSFSFWGKSPGIWTPSMNTTGFTLTLPIQLPQSLIIYAKVVRYFMSESAMDNPASIFRGAGAHFYGTSVDADSIRQDQTIVMGALCLGDAVIET